MSMISKVADFLGRFLKGIFKQKGQVKLGLYGPPNGGKTTLANRICKDWIGEELGVVSSIAHETREVQVKEEITISENGKELTFNLVDTPGIATKIDYEDFWELMDERPALAHGVIKVLALRLDAAMDNLQSLSQS